MNKREVLNLVIDFLQKEESVLIHAALSAKEAATESEARPENQYDTRGLEQSYLAAGQGRRAEAVKMGIIHLKALQLHQFGASSAINISALVSLESEDGDVTNYFILPSHGGIKVKYKDKEISTLSPESPLAENLLGKFIGDSVEVRLGNQIRSYSILSVI